MSHSWMYCPPYVYYGLVKIIFTQKRRRMSSNSRRKKTFIFLLWLFILFFVLCNVAHDYHLIFSFYYSLFHVFMSLLYIYIYFNYHVCHRHSHWICLNKWMYKKFAHKSRTDQLLSFHRTKVCPIIFSRLLGH